MSQDEPPVLSNRERLLSSYLVWLWVAPLVPLSIVLLYFMFGGKAAPQTGRTGSVGQMKENGVETARQGLTRQTDLNTCSVALQQINAEWEEHPTLRPPALTADQKAWLGDQLHLDDDERNEVEADHFTPLDNHHLFRCFLLRDAADALEVKGVRNKPGGPMVREKPLDRAARAFAWVMRQVRLTPKDQGKAVPPSFVLRRGWGSALERALVFLALLDQLGRLDAPQPELLGCLLQVPDSTGASRLWACGVVVGDGKDVYLFDPHLGLPLPGPKGEGIATLAQVREQPEVLAQLHSGDKQKYPVTAEQARAAQAQLVCPLSALSLRMRYLQDKILAPGVRVRLAADALAQQERLKAACSAGAKKPVSVIAAREHSTLLRQFLPPNEGGVDATAPLSRLTQFTMALVPWNPLPRAFLDENLFPRKSEMGMRVHQHFAGFFITPTLEPGQARDLLLRGNYSSAMPLLVRERDRWRDQQVQRANVTDLQEKVQKWLDRAIEDYARLYRARQARQTQEIQLAEQKVRELWEGRNALPISLVLDSAVATHRKPEVEYQLALCAQEQAEQLQARLDLQAGTGTPPHRHDVEKARSEWQNALNAWKRFEEDAPELSENAADRATRSAMRAAARRLRGRAEALLGNHQAAIALWKDVTGFPTDLEKLGPLYLAQQWEKKHPQ